MESVTAASPPVAAALSTLADSNVNGKRPRDDADSRPQHPHGRQKRHHNHQNQKRRRKGNGRQPPKPAPPPVPVCSVCCITEEEEDAKETSQSQQQATPAATPKEPPKYKCPKCRALYCSVACCRKHKLICPGKPPETALEIAAAAAAADPIQSNNNTAHNDNDAENFTSDDSDDESLEEGWKITDEMKEALQKSSWLHEELQDGGLRGMIAQVVRSSKKAKLPRHNKHHRHKHHRKPAASLAATTSHNPAHDALLEQRNENPNFNIFCDKLLVLAGVLERQNVDGDRMAAASASTTKSSSSGTPNAPRDSQELEQWLKQKWEPDQPPPNLALKPIRKKAVPKFDPVDVSSSSESEESEEEEDSNDDDSNGSGASSEESR